MKSAVAALLLLSVASAYAQDRDLSVFGAPPPEPSKPVKTKAEAPAEGPKVLSKADLLMPPTVLPPRTYPAGNGFAKIQARGRGLDFTFNDARFAEAVAEISKTFDCVITYAGDPDRRIVGHYSNIRSPGELLALLTDMTDLMVVVTQRGFIVQQIDSPRIPTLKLDDLVEAGLY